MKAVIKDLVVSLLRLVLLWVGVIVVCLVSGHLLFLIAMYVPEDPGMDAAFQPVWSPDGRAIAFECVYYRLEDREFLEEIYHPPLHDICVINRDGTDLRRITQQRNQYMPAWSPNGRSIAWWDGSHRKIIIQDLDTGEQRSYPLKIETVYDRSDSWLEWTPDGQKILFQGCSIQFDIISGSLIYSPEYDIQDPCGGKVWSPSGERLFTLKPQNPEDFDELEYNLRVYDLEKLLVSSEMKVGRLVNPSWNTEGTMIAFNARYPIPTNDRLFIIKAENGETIEIKLDSDITCQYPEWIAGKQQISCDDSNKIYLLSLVGSPDRMNLRISEYLVFRMDKVGSYEKSVHWAPDGSSFLYEDDDGKISLISEDGNKKQLVP